MDAAKKPTILFIHGAWHKPSHYALLQAVLEAAGYEVLVPALPSRTEEVGITWREDVAAIHALVEPHMDAGKEFVIGCHSYGGIPGCAATKGYTVEERGAEGKKGGFRGILFVSAFSLPRRGMDLLDAREGRYPEFMTYETPYKMNASCFVTPEAKHGFYNDLPDDEAQKHLEALGPHSQDAFETPVDFVAPDLTIPMTYLVCEKDATIAAANQEKLAASIPGMKIERVDAGHSPFLSRPERVAEVLMSL